MRKITFTCPRCSAKLSAATSRLEMRITCPKCQLEFVPENEAAPIEEPTPGTSTARAARKLDTSSRTCRQLAVIAVCLLIAALVWAAISVLQDNHSWIAALGFASAAFAAAILLWFASQILAARAQLFKIHGELRSRSKEEFQIH